LNLNITCLSLSLSLCTTVLYPSTQIHSSSFYQILTHPSSPLPHQLRCISIVFWVPSSSLLRLNEVKGQVKVNFQNTSTKVLSPVLFSICRRRGMKQGKITTFDYWDPPPSQRTSALHVGSDITHTHCPVSAVSMP
jgi:hypothetical protein